MTTPRESLFSVKRLESGYWHLRGDGPCNWAQPRDWPCASETDLEASFFPEAGDRFRALVRTENDRLLRIAARTRCAECGVEFPVPVSEEQAEADWGAAAADEIGYACQRCADEFDGTAANAR